MSNLHVRYARYTKVDGTSLEPLVAGVVVARFEAVPGGCRPAGRGRRNRDPNCTIRGFYQGIRLARDLAQEKDAAGACKRVDERHYYTGYDASRARDYTYEEEYALERSALYEHAPKHVRIVDSTVERNGHAGIYVIAYSQFFSIEGTTIRNNGSVGIYLAHETRYTTIRGSSIVHNGWGSRDTLVDYGVPGAGEIVKASREGIAIDASAHNTLSHNRMICTSATTFATKSGCQFAGPCW